ncbi:MAG: helix-turn-helix transcriptional regulator, partial [Pyrinomonadaceae bacterium]|nr:helix-turn-helix transcriptional regulator [Sphingobacteriaceae bacterium]
VMVIHFDKDFWGQAFWLMPESKEIAQLLDQSMLAIKLSSEGKAELTTAITSLETATGFERITLLCKCLLLISRESNKQTLSTLLVKESSFFNDDKINKVFEYTINHFKSPIDLKTVALLANLSVPSFCRYFKKNTKKTYVEFLNEMRVGHACQALIDSDRNILEISTDCGFNTISNFNKQFLKIKGIKPSVYKKNFKLKMIYK